MAEGTRGQGFARKIEAEINQFSETLEKQIVMLANPWKMVAAMDLKFKHFNILLKLINRQLKLCAICIFYFDRTIVILLFHCRPTCTTSQFPSIKI